MPAHKVNMSKCMYASTCLGTQKHDRATETALYTTATNEYDYSDYTMQTGCRNQHVSPPSVNSLLRYVRRTGHDGMSIHYS